MKAFLKIFLPVVILGAGVALFASLKASRPEPVAMQAPEKSWTVAVETIERRDIQPRVLLYGRVESPARSTLKAALEAEVLEVNVREGDVVRRGDLLVELDAGDLELALSQREAEIRELEARMEAERRRAAADRSALADEQALLDLAQRSLARAERLASTQAGSEAGVDEARQVIRQRSLSVVQRQLDLDNYPSRVAQLEANLARADAARAEVARDLERTRIRAPFDGRITGVQVAAGGRVRVGDALLELFDTSKLEVRAQIPERHLPAVRRSVADGAPVDAAFGLEGRDYPVRLARLAGAIREGQGGLDGFFQFADPGVPNLEIGRVAKLALRLPAIEGAVSLPVGALYDADTVYRVVDGRLESTTVEYAGEHEDDAGDTRAIVRSATLVDGDVVAATQIPAAVDGLKVTIAKP